MHKYYCGNWGVKNKVIRKKGDVIRQKLTSSLPYTPILQSSTLSLFLFVICPELESNL